MKSLDDLLAELSPERRARVEARAKQLMAKQAAALTHDEWIRRYRAEWRKRRPDLNDDTLTPEALDTAFETYSAPEYFPDDPEGAVNHMIVEWEGEGREAKEGPPGV